MKRDYKDHTITLDDNWRFTVEGPLFERALTCLSMSDAEQAIDQRHAARVKQQKAENSFAVTALDDNGVQVVVRGIHSSQGHLLGVKSDRVYPVHPPLRDKLIRRATLMREVKALDDQLKPFSVMVRRTYGHTRPDKYDELLKGFTDEFAAKSAKVDEQ
jgi:hypothetical protein